MPTFRAVYALSTSEMVAPRRIIIAGARGFFRLPMMCFALEATDGFYLVDTGTTHSWIERPLIAMGLVRSGETMRITTRLRAIGADPAALRGVFLTHLDYDHKNGLRDLGLVPITACTREIEAAYHPTSRDRLRVRYSGYLPPEARIRAVEPDGPSDLAHVGRAADLFGDGSLLMVDLPGHTRGHVGYRVRCADGRRILLSGDALFAMALLKGGAPGFFPRFVAQDLETMLATIEQLRALARDDPSLVIAPSHDEALGERARSGPVAL